MTWLWQSHRLCRLFGIEIRIAHSLYAFIGFLAFSHLMRDSLVHAAAILLVLLGLPVCILLHELGHSLVAMAKGMRVPRITMTMIGGCAEMEGLLSRPKDEMLVAAAGPAVSFALAGLLFAPYYFSALHQLPILPTLLGNLFFLNLVLGLFNLLPIYPMDGGRIAGAVLVRKYGQISGLTKTMVLSKYGAMAMGAVGLYFMMNGGTNGPILMLIAWYIFTRGRQELLARISMARQTATPWSSIFSHPVSGSSQAVWVYEERR